MKLFRRLANSLTKRREDKPTSVRDFRNEKALKAALKDKKKNTPGEDGKDWDGHDTSSSSSLSNASRESIQNVDWKLTNFDAKSTEPQTMEQELKRLKSLQSYFILDSDYEEEFDRITRLAAMTFDTSMATVTFVDLGRQWFMSTIGVDARETPREIAFCSHVVLNKYNQLIVPDATKDVRFKNSPLVTGGPKIRFYAGAAILSPEGFKLGAMCAISPTPRPQGLSEKEQKMLHEMAGMVTDLLELRRDRLVKKQYETKMLELGKIFADTATSMQTTAASISSTKNDTSLARAVDELQTQAQVLSATARSLLETDEATDKKTVKERTDCEAWGNLEALDDIMEPKTNLPKLLTNVETVLRTFPYKSDTLLELEGACPEKIIGEDLLLFRSTLGLVSHSMGRVEPGGKVHFRMSQSKDCLMFECEDTGAKIPKAMVGRVFHDPESLLAPVTTMVRSLEGKYGMRLGRLSGEESSRCIFWFRVPLEVPSTFEDCVQLAKGMKILLSPKVEPVPGKLLDDESQVDPFRAALMQSGCLSCR